jgi:hypothetical protein
MEVLGVILLLVLVFVSVEYRFRKPDEIILAESPKGLSVRTARLYPRHFSLVLGRTTHSIQVSIDASAKGNLEAKVRLAATVAAAPAHLAALMRVGGWQVDAIARAAKELEPVLIGSVKEFCEMFEIQELSSQRLRDFLATRIPDATVALGLEVLSLTILSFEPSDKAISEALRQQEQARILEQTELLNQKARVAGTRAKLRADEEIAILEHDLELKKLELKKQQVEREAELAFMRVEDELKRNRKKLAFDREELEMIKANPELLLLTPQAARLAEASQGLKNARTIVSFSPQDLARGSELLGMFQSFFENTLESCRSVKKPEKK